MGFLPWVYVVGLALMQVAHLCVRLPLASQRDAGRTSCTPPAPSHGDHTPSATQTWGAVHTARGKGPSLECDPVRTPSPPPNGSDYGPVRAYVSAPVDPVRLSDSDPLEDEAPPDERHADPSGRSECAPFVK